MNKTKRIAFGIGIVLAVLAAFTASAAATNVAYFDPDPSCIAPGETVYVELRLNSTEGVTSMETDVYFDLDVLNITDAVAGDFPNQFGCGWHGNYIAMGGVTPDWLDLPPGDYLFANLTVEANNTGTCALTYARNHLWDEMFDEIFDVAWHEGTFNCPCVVPMPDLVITDKYETLAGDGTFTVTYTVKNIGDADAGASTTAVTTTAGQSASDSVSALLSGASHTGTVGPFDCECGTTVTVTVCADSTSVVDESDENNNCLSNDLVCHPCPKPDLVITEKYETLAGDGTFTVTYTVTNIGAGSAGASTTSITADGQSANDPTVPPLAPSASYTSTVGGFNCPCGTNVTVTVCADSMSVVDESDETNNCLSNDLVCHPCPKPDLVITEKYETLLEGGTFTVTYTVTNIGAGSAGASTTSITADGQSANDPTVPPLAPSASYTSTVGGFNCPCGTTITVTVCADSTSVVVESDETNNCLSNELTCQLCGLPDLVITDIWCKIGDKKNTYDIFYNITNIGDANAGRSTSNLTVDGVPTNKRDGVKPLAAGQTRIGEKFTYRSKIAPTTIKVCADCGKKSITESNETNNCMEKTVTCT